MPARWLRRYLKLLANYWGHVRKLGVKPADWAPLGARIEVEGNPGAWTHWCEPRPRGIG
jgi:hypothetical protein